MSTKSTGPFSIVGLTRAEVGEGPCWDDERGRLWWVDLLAGLVHCSELSSGETETFSTGEPVGAVGLRSTGGLVAADKRGFSLLTGEGRVEERFDVLSPSHRMNDAKVGPGGHYWAGSNAMDFHAGRGALHVLSPDGAVETVLDGLTLPNGLGWSPAGDVFYLVDSLQGWLRAWDCDATTGTLSNQRTLATFPGGDEVPDGMCVDGDGNLWVAIWGGSRLERYTPEGEPMGPLHTPVSQPSCCAFAGPRLDMLIVTSAYRGLAGPRTALDGALFCLPAPGAPGLAVARFAA